MTSLSKDSEYIINKNDRFNLKIVFSNVNLNDQIYMCNNWTSYNSLTDRYIRKAELYLINDNFNKLLISWVDFISINNDIVKKYSKKNINYYNNIRVVERLISNISFIWDEKINNEFYIDSDIVNFKIDKLDDLLNIIQPLKSINIYNNFVQNIKLDTMEELAHEQYYDSKIGVIDLETFPVNKTENLETDNYSNSGFQQVYAGGWRIGDVKKFYYLGDQGCNNSDALIKTMILDIFNSGYSNYTFYAHNLSRFDGHFITKSLLVDLNNFEKFEDINLIVRDSNDIIEITIKR